VRTPAFFIASIVVAAVVFVVASLIGNDYLFFAGYTVVQFIVLASAWNILGGYCGYVNFGTAGFFALGAYTAVFFHKTYPLPIPVLLLLAALVSGLVGLGMGYLTLRLRGAFFSIATLALAVVLQTFVVNWDYVGGSRGAYVIRPNSIDIFGYELDYVRYLCLIMLVLAAVAVAIARTIERSKLGYGFATIRDDELAAEASGVPTLKLKLIATTLSGALMGMAGAPFPYYIGYVEPASTFGLPYAVNSIAMPLIGGTTSWVGPLIGSILLGTLQQVATVTISSAVNLLIVGLLLVDCVILAPNGIVGLFRDRRSVAALDQAIVFILLYILNLLPMFFLTGQGFAAQLFGLAFWVILFIFAFARGVAIRRTWLAWFPVVGAILSLVPVDDTTPVLAAIADWAQKQGWSSLNAAGVMMLISTAVQLVGLICALGGEARELKEART
jgi:branched-chain amino acid transport system permease protein